MFFIFFIDIFLSNLTNMRCVSFFSHFFILLHSFAHLHSFAPKNSKIKIQSFANDRAHVFICIHCIYIIHSINTNVLVLFFAACITLLNRFRGSNGIYKIYNHLIEDVKRNTHTRDFNTVSKQREENKW